MLNTPQKKNKVVLSDYNYRKDIENRLHMAQLSAFEVDVLREVLNSSISFKVSELADSLEKAERLIISVLDRLASTKLLLRQGDKVSVDKEMRKYYEFHIEKFDDDFRPDIEFILSSLNKVPINVLPVWYQIPRTSDNIIASLIEKYLQTPKVYERYLQELCFEDPIMTGIMNDVFHAPDYKLRARLLIEKYHLTREQFEEYMLLLEYHFVCYLSYMRVDDMWVEKVTPFQEWRDYLCFQRDTTPKALPAASIRFSRSQEFAFLQDLNALIKVGMQGSVPVVASKNGGHSVSLEAVMSWFPQMNSEDPILVQEYFDRILAKLELLKIVQCQQGKMMVLEEAKHWLKRQLPDQAMTLYRHPDNVLSAAPRFPHLYVEKNIREAEKSLRRVSSSGWVLFEDFMRGMMNPVGSAEPVALKNKGKRWKYTIPSYTPEEQELIQLTVFERLFEAGMVATGWHDGKLCFSVTPFGRLAIGE